MTNSKNKPSAHRNNFKINLPTVILSLSLLFGGNAVAQTQNRAQSGAVTTEAGNARILSDGSNFQSESQFATRLDHLNYNGNIYLVYKEALNKDLVDYFDYEFNLPGDYIFFGFTKNKNGTGKGESKVSVFNSRFRDNTISQELQNQFTAGLKQLKASGQLNQKNVLELATSILEEHLGGYTTQQEHQEETNNDNNQGNQPQVSNNGNNDNDEGGSNFLLWLVIGGVVIGGIGLYIKYPHLFIKKDDGENEGNENNQTLINEKSKNPLETKLQDDIAKLNELEKQYNFFIENTNIYQYILPDNFEEILIEAGERITIFKNAKNTGTFNDNTGLLGTSIGKEGKIKEDLSLTESALEGLKKLGFCYSIISTIDQIQTLLNNAETQSVYKESDIASSRATYEKLKQSNTNWIDSPLLISSFTELESKKTKLIATLQEVLQELTGATPVSGTPSGNQYEALFETTPSAQKSERKTKNRTDQLYDEEYLITTSDYCSKLIANIKEEIDDISGILDKINTLPTTIAQYEQEYNKKVSSIESLSISIKQRKEQHPQLVTIDSSITTLEKESDSQLSQANTLHGEPKKDRPKLNTKISTSLQCIEKADGIYKNFHNAKENYLATKVSIETIWSELTMYTENGDYNTLPEYASQGNIASKIAQLPHSDSKKENWFDLHKDALALYETLTNLKIRFQQYKTAKENYQNNITTIRNLNIRLIGLARDADRTYHQIIIYEQRGNRFILEEQTNTTLRQMRATESDFESEIENQRSTSRGTNVVIIGGGNGGWQNNDDNGGSNNDRNSDPTPDAANNDNSGAGTEI